MSWACVNRAACLAALLLLAACSAGEAPLEDRVQALIDRMAQAVEQGSVRAAVDYLHPEYRDRRHNSRREAGTTLFGLLRRHRQLHLFTLTQSIVAGPDRASAQAVVYVAMTGVPAQSVDALISLKADLYRFDLDLVETDDGWRVRSSQWQRVDPRIL